MRIPPRRLIFGLVLLLSAVFLVAACGGEEEEAQPPPETLATTAAAPPAAAPEPAEPAGPSGEPIIIGRRGTEQAVLLSQEEYERLRRVEEQAAEARFKEALEAIRAEVRKEKLPRKVVDEAIRWARRR